MRLCKGIMWAAMTSLVLIALSGEIGASGGCETRGAPTPNFDRMAAERVR